MNPQHVTLITLGVSDLDRSRAFYVRWGWRVHSRSLPDITFFQMNSAALALYEINALADDQERDATELGTGAVTLGIGGESAEKVDRIFADALRAGATEIKTPQKAFWGGYSGYVSDPDGHVWEIAMNPNWPLDEDGGLTLPPEV